MSSIEFLLHHDYPSLIEFCVKTLPTLFMYLPTVLQLPQQTHNTVNYGTADIHRATLHRQLCVEEEAGYEVAVTSSLFSEVRETMGNGNGDIVLRNRFPSHGTE